MACTQLHYDSMYVKSDGHQKTCTVIRYKKLTWFKLIQTQEPKRGTRRLLKSLEKAIQSNCFTLEKYIVSDITWKSEDIKTKMSLTILNIADEQHIIVSLTLNKRRSRNAMFSG